jgi:single-stranded DNA-specific DHH superfamily exonuclease
VAILADAPGSSGLLAGSVRSDGTSDVLATLEQCPALTSFGGHARAAGLKLRSDDLGSFRGQWAAAAGRLASPSNAAAVELPEVGLAEFTSEFETDMGRPSPFGSGLPAPRAVLQECTITRLNLMGRDKTHVSLTVSDGQRELRMVGFRQSHIASRQREGDRVRPLVEIDVDNYNNQCTIQVRLVELTGINGARHSNSR